MTIYIRRATKRRANPKKALGRRFALGDRVKLSIEGYESKDVGTVVKHLSGRRIRVDYPSRGYQIDAKINEFIRVPKKKRSSRAHKRTKNPQKKSFTTGGFVLHRIPITNKTHASAWFDERGNLLDSELIDSRTHRGRGRARGKTIDYLQKLGERYLHARDT